MRSLTFRFVAGAQSECMLLARIVSGGRSFLASQAALFIGLFYLVGPIDLIPARGRPVTGHMDELAFLLAGLFAAHWLAPSRRRTRLAEAPAGETTRNDMQDRLGVVPNFFIVGASRSGTTSLFAAIGRHPDVFCCPVKEPNHFATDRNRRRSVIESARRRDVLISPGMTLPPVLPRVAVTPDYQAYLGLFAAWEGQYAIGEASTLYLASSTAAEEIAHRQPRARIVMVLRQPVARAQSEYLMHRQLGRPEAELDAIIDGRVPPTNADGEEPPDVVRGSRYAPQIRRYLTAFPREQILFLLFDDMLADPDATLRQVFAHIGVDASDRGIRIEHHNQSRVVRAATLNTLLFRSGLREVALRLAPAMLRSTLARKYYAPGTLVRPTIPPHLFADDIGETSKLIGRDLSHWLN